MNDETTLVLLRKTLTAKQIELAASVYFDGLTLREIAAQEGISFQAVHLRLQAVIRKLENAGFPEPQRRTTYFRPVQPIFQEAWVA